MGKWIVLALAIIEIVLLEVLKEEEK